MKKLLALSSMLLVFLVLTSGAIAAPKVDMTGTWAIEVETANGTGNPTFELKQEGDALTGSYSGRFGEEDVTGKVSGNTFEINYESSGIPVKYSGTIEGNKIKGEVDFADYGKGTFTGKK